jgi:hypothetical protein
VLRKDACGNSPPPVSINLPRDGDVISFGSMQQFSATASDPEDGPFPMERLRFVSDRNGLIGNGRLVFSNRLSPGAHAITFSATDSGGLTATARVRVTVENRPPDRPVIVRPESDDMVVATEPVATRTGEAVPMADSVGETYRQAVAVEAPLRHVTSPWLRSSTRECQRRGGEFGPKNCLRNVTVIGKKGSWQLAASCASR